MIDNLVSVGSFMQIVKHKTRFINKTQEYKWRIKMQHICVVLHIYKQQTNLTFILFK